METTLTSATAERIMDAAGELFAEQGFRQTSIRDICAHANVNLAAVNYHFRDKEGLYEAILLRSYEQCQRLYPIIVTGELADVRLEGFVRMLLMRLLGKGRPAWHGKLMAAEMADPTGALNKLVEEAIRPTHRILLGIVRDLMGNATEPEIQSAASSILGQCLFYRHARPVIELLHVPIPAEEADIAALAHRITQFSLAGIAGVHAEVNHA
jgi:AcrR family transcriptional regulator